MQPGRGQHAGAECKPPRVVVIAGDHHHRHAETDHNPVQYIVQKLHRLGRRHRAVKDIAGEQHRVRPCVLHQPGKFRAQHMRLVLAQRKPAEGTPEMPIGGVQKSHAGAE